MSLPLPPLPWAADGLEPYISKKTIEYHHGKHHRAYVDKVNALVADTPLEGNTLEELIKASADRAELATLYDNAAQAWNHDFFWKSMKPRGGVPPKGALQGKIIASFGTYDQFKEAFVQEATSLFGSGWVWLVLDRGRTEIMRTANADCPLSVGKAPLLTLDVWEHAYYIDYRNRRADFVRAFLDRLVNWEFASTNLVSYGEKAPTAQPPLPSIGKDRGAG